MSKFYIFHTANQILKQRMKGLLPLISFCIFFLPNLSAQNSSSLWTEVNESTSMNLAKRQARSITPDVYKTLHLDANALKRVLTSVPSEEETGNSPSLPFEVLMSDGKVESFYLTEYSIMEPDLVAKFPEIKTYHGYGVNDASHLIRLDWTSSGINAMLQLPEGVAFIKPYSVGDVKHHLSYFGSDVPEIEEPFECGTTEEKGWWWIYNSD